MEFVFDSRKETFKTPFGAVKRDTAVTFRVNSDADSIYLLGFGDRVEMANDNGVFSATVMPNINTGLVHYSFEAAKGSERFAYGKADKGSIAVKNGRPYQLTVHQNSDNPGWFTGSVIYQIYVERFYKGSTDEVRMRDNVLMHTSWSDKPLYIKDETGKIVSWDFFGGNLAGVIEKLGYLQKIGVDVIYLNPIFESISNHKYDTADYNEIDRMYGTTETLRRLVAESDKRGIKIMLDGVFSHTGDDSIYFNKYKTYGEGGAFNDPNSPYDDWYSFEKYPGKYTCWWNVTSLPCVNELTPSFIDFLLNEEHGAVIKWMKLGIAGWRLDVADELPDEFIKQLKNAILKVDPQAVLLGEVWEDASNKISYDHARSYILDASLDSVSNYPLRESLISLLTGKADPREFGEVVMSLQENYPRNVFLSLMNMTGTHDTARLATLLGDAPDPKSMSTWKQRDYLLPEQNAQLALKRLCLYFVILYTLPGNPCVYYGDEICLQGYADPYNRGTFDWNSRQTAPAGLMRELSLLRKELNTKDGFVRFDDNNAMLSYTVSAGGSSYSVYANTTSTQQSVSLDSKSDAVYTHHSAKNDSGFLLEPLGALVIKNS